MIGPKPLESASENDLMSIDDASRTPRRIVPAPAPSNPRLRSMVVDVECAGHEDVEWHWTETTEGRFVSGYSIVPRLGT